MPLTLRSLSHHSTRSSPASLFLVICWHALREDHIMEEIPDIKWVTMGSDAAALVSLGKCREGRGVTHAPIPSPTSRNRRMIMGNRVVSGTDGVSHGSLSEGTSEAAPSVPSTINQKWSNGWLLTFKGF